MSERWNGPSNTEVVLMELAAIRDQVNSIDHRINDALTKLDMDILNKDRTLNSAIRRLDNAQRAIVKAFANVHPLDEIDQLKQRIEELERAQKVVPIRRHEVDG